MPEPVFRGAPRVRRVKHYAAETGHTYRYSYCGWRPTGTDAAEHYFEFRRDGASAATLCIRVLQSNLDACAAAIGREVVSPERYAIVKLALFRTLDETPEPARRRSDRSHGQPDRRVLATARAGLVMADKNGSGPLDRIEALLRNVAERQREFHLVQEHDHEESKRDHKPLMTCQVLMQEKMDRWDGHWERMQATQQAEQKRLDTLSETTDKRIGQLVVAIGRLTEKRFGERPADSIRVPRFRVRRCCAFTLGRVSAADTFAARLCRPPPLRLLPTYQESGPNEWFLGAEAGPKSTL